MSHSQSFSFRFAQVDSLRHVCRHKYPCHALPISGDRSWRGKTFRRSQISPEILRRFIQLAHSFLFKSKWPRKTNRFWLHHCSTIYLTLALDVVYLLSMGLPCLVNSRNVTDAPWRMRSKFPPSWYYPRLCVCFRVWRSCGSSKKPKIKPRWLDARATQCKIFSMAFVCRPVGCVSVGRVWFSRCWRTFFSSSFLLLH